MSGKSIVCVYSSPLQLVNAHAEAATRSVGDAVYVFLESRVERSNQLVLELSKSLALEPVLTLSPAPVARDIPEQSDLALLNYERDVLGMLRGAFPNAACASELVLGDLRPFAIACIIGYFRTDSVTVVDDGTATPTVLELREFGETPLSSHSPFQTVFGAAASSAANVDVRRVHAKTIYPSVGAFGDRVELNRVAPGLRPTQVEPGEVWLVGSNHIESGITTAAGHYGLLDEIVSYYGPKRFKYFPHRRQSSESLATIAAMFDFDIVDTELSFEQFLKASAYVPAAIASTFSTVVDIVARQLPSMRLVDLFLPHQRYYTGKRNDHANAIVRLQRANLTGNVNVIELDGFGCTETFPGLEDQDVVTTDFTSGFGCSMLKAPQQHVGLDRSGRPYRPETYKCTSIAGRRLTVQSTSSFKASFALGEVVCMSSDETSAQNVLVVAKDRQYWDFELLGKSGFPDLEGKTVTVARAWEYPTWQADRPVGIALGFGSPLMRFEDLARAGITATFDGVVATPERGRLFDPTGVPRLTRIAEVPSHGLHRLVLDWSEREGLMGNVSFFWRGVGRQNLRVRRVFGDERYDVTLREQLLEPNVDVYVDDVRVTGTGTGWFWVSCPVSRGGVYSKQLQLLILADSKTESAFHHGCAGRGIVLSHLAVALPQTTIQPVTGDSNGPLPGVKLGSGLAAILSLRCVTRHRTELRLRINDIETMVRLVPGTSTLPTRITADAGAGSVWEIPFDEELSDEALQLAIVGAKDAIWLGVLDRGFCDAVAKLDFKPVKVELLRTGHESQSPFLARCRFLQRQEALRDILNRHRKLIRRRSQHR